MAEVRVELDRLDGLRDRAWRHYEEAQANLREVGVQSDALLSHQLEAAYGAWKLHGPRDTRLQLTQLPEAPVE
jgi:hypothetical protein